MRAFATWLLAFAAGLFVGILAGSTFLDANPSTSVGPGGAYFLAAPAMLPEDPLPPVDSPPETSQREPAQEDPGPVLVGRDGQAWRGELPCEELELELEALRGANANLERSILDREHIFLASIQSPYASAIASGEFDRATLKERQWLQALLENVPVPLLPGEARWLVDRKQANDWMSWGGVEPAMLAFFGRERLVAALGEERFARVFE